MRAAAFTVTFAVVGIEVTVLGLMLQLPFPESSEQLNVIVPVNPESAVTLIGPLVVLLPAFTTGNASGSLSAKSGLLLRLCKTALAACVVCLESVPTAWTLK